MKQEDYNEALLVRAAKGQVTAAEMNITRVEARLNNFPISHLDERALIVALTKIITDVFDYFNCAWNESIVSMLINDILAEYKHYSILEIYKAIHEGRRSQAELYGKLSGRHFTTWINDYLAKMGDEISEYRRNEKFEMMNAIDNLHIPGAEIRPGKPKKAAEKPRFSAQEKASAYSAIYNRSKKERLRDEHSYAWSLDEHGDYQAYMESYDRKMADQAKKIKP